MPDRMSFFVIPAYKLYLLVLSSTSMSDFLYCNILLSDLIYH